MLKSPESMRRFRPLPKLMVDKDGDMLSHSTYLYPQGRLRRKAKEGQSVLFGDQYMP